MYVFYGWYTKYKHIYIHTVCTFHSLSLNYSEYDIWLKLNIYIYVRTVYLLSEALEELMTHRIYTYIPARKLVNI